MLSVLDLSHHDSREKLDKVLHKLKWNDFPGLQALLLKVTKTVMQGSYRSWKTWKVMELKNFFFEAWKVTEFNCRSLKVMEN